MADGHAYAGLASPHAFRRHQQEALDALDAAWDAGRDRAWVVLPPGAGKTLVGLETIRRAGRPAVVLSPNTAIQGQWVAGWRSLTGHTGDPTAIGTDRDLTTPVTALTYQSMAVFGRDEATDEDGGGAELGRLHPHGRALVERLRDLGPLTLVLDECHHLLESWGRLLVEVLDLLPQARVLGLTATPPTTLSTDQAALVEELFGAVVHATSIPAVVREGHLAPFVDLVWLTRPTATEQEWLDGQRERFAELTTALTDPTYGSTPFLTWVDQRFAGDVPFARVAQQDPPLADAALRLAHVGLLRLHDDDATTTRASGTTLGEQHRRPPDDQDWALLVDDWHDHCLARSDDPRDDLVRDGLRRALPSVGWQLTRTGVRRGRSPVDRVLARSAAKSRALVEIVAAEHRVLGERLAMLVICDHEAATATVPADLTGVVGTRAGSARLALADLLADPATAGLDPVMVTGRTVAAAPATLERLRDRVRREQPDLDLVVGEPDPDGVAELTGGPGWSSRTWVRAVTALFLAGECRVLVGTRALLGEGWDAPRATGLVDLSTTTTTGSIVQTRGRTLRLDPRDPDKVAVNWTVCTVAPEHPRGESDWQRTVRKHDGYFGVDGAGDVVDGVAHVHPSFSPFAAPDPTTFDATNAAMLVRAEQRPDVARAWAVGRPYDDAVRVAAWVRPARLAAATPPPGAADGDHSPPTPRPVVLTAAGLRGATHWPRPVPATAVAAVVAAVVVLGALWTWWVLLGVVPVGAGAAARRRRVLAERRAVLAEALVPPDLVGLAGAVADGLHDAGLVPVGAEALTWHPDPDGRVRFELVADGPRARDHSALFAEALAELVGPVGAAGAPRYLVPRPVVTATPDDRTLLRTTRPGDVRPDGQVWHPVPTVLGTRAERAACFARAWDRWVGGGPALHTGNPEGAGVLAAVRGGSGMADDTVLRLSWH